MTNKERILIVDDDESTCRTLKLIFGKEGYEVEIARTGREAIEKVQRSFFNVILLDIKLPDIEGIELLTPLKELNPDMVVIMVTAYATMETAVLALHEGASAYITKPLNMEEVLARVREALEKQRLVMENRRLYEELQRELDERKRAEEKIKEYAENLEKLVEERTKALRESEEKLKAILTGIADLITIQNKDLDIIWANQPIIDNWGDIIGKKCYKVYKGLTEPCPDCYVETVFNEEKTVISERIDTLPDGRHIHLLISSSPVRDAEGNIVAVMEVEKDITERKNLERKLEEYTESLEKVIEKRKELELRLKDYTDNLEKIVEERTKALRESEEKLKVILAGIGDLITIQNKDLDIIWVNQPLKELWGNVIGKKCYKAYRELDEPCLDCTVETVMKEGKTIVSERTGILPDGNLIELFTTSSPMYDDDGNIIAVVEVSKDITERKKLEVELKASEARYRGLYESSIDGIVSFDLEGKIVECNQAFVDMLGYSKEELQKLTIFDITPNKWHEMSKKIHTEIIVRGYSEEFEKEYIMKDGTIFPVAIRGWVIKDKEGKPTGIWGIVRDITERKKAEEKIKEYAVNLEMMVEERTLELRESEELYKTLMKTSPDAVTVTDLDGRIIEVSQRALELYGAENADELLGRSAFELIAPEDHEEAMINLQKTLQEDVVRNLEYTLLRKGGSRYIGEMNTAVIKDAYGTLKAFMATTRDITERKRVEEALRESEERYRGLYESSLDGIVSMNMDLNIVEYNQAFAEMLGYTKEELYKLNAYKITSSKGQDILTKIFTEQKGYLDEPEIKFIKKDGTIFPVSVRAWQIKDKDGKPTGMWGIVRDITERYRLMEMKEQFISVATHELRTPLISIKGYVDYLLTEDSESIAGLIEPSLKVVRRNTDRLLHLTDDLLDIQRIKAERLPLELEPLNFIELINHCAEEIRPFLNKKKQNFHLEVPDGPLLIRGDCIRLSQVIMNLLSNATKFTPEGGDITLSVEEKEDDIQIIVSDTGIGIRGEDLERIFQPFTDIKKSTHIKGTGLGLSVTKGLIEAHGGKIWAHSDGEGKGATFTFTLPK